MKFYSEDEIRPLIEALEVCARPGTFHLVGDIQEQGNYKARSAITAFRAVKPRVAREWWIDPNDNGAWQLPFEPSMIHVREVIKGEE